MKGRRLILNVANVELFLNWLKFFHFCARPDEDINESTIRVSSHLTSSLEIVEVVQLEFFFLYQLIILASVRP